MNNLYLLGFVASTNLPRGDRTLNAYRNRNEFVYRAPGYPFMARDITEQIKLAFSRSTSWSKQNFITNVESLEHLIPGSKRDWDEYANENWASIYVGDEVVAYLSINYPLLFLQNELVSISCYFDKLVVIYFIGVNSSEFSIHPELFKEWSQGKSNTGELDAQALSASDIWWATIV